MEKRTEKLEIFNKVMLKILLVVGIAIAVLLAIYFFQNYQYKKLTKRENLTLDQYIAFTVIDELGDTNDKKERFVSSDELDGYKRVFLNMDGHYNNVYQVEKATSQTMKVLEILAKDREFYDTEFNGISFQWMITAINDYGDEADIVGCIITLDKPEIYKIKWGSVAREGFIRIAKTYWVHDLLLE